MASTLKFNHKRINAVGANAKTALRQTAEELHTTVVNAHVMPFDTGTLQNTATSVSELKQEGDKTVCTIIHDTPYAEIVYFHPEYNFQTKDNANARGLWWEDWLPGGTQEKFAAVTFKKFLSRLEKK